MHHYPVAGDVDMRFDLEISWRAAENENGGKTILVKLVIPSCSNAEVQSYLQDKGIVNAFVFPDSCNI